jgi:hypothetical protein
MCLSVRCRYVIMCDIPLCMSCGMFVMDTVECEEPAQCKTELVV